MYIIVVLLFTGLLIAWLWSCKMLAYYEGYEDGMYKTIGILDIGLVRSLNTYNKHPVFLIREEQNNVRKHHFWPNYILPIHTGVLNRSRRVN